MPLINPYVLAGMGHPYFGMINGRPGASYGGYNEASGPAVLAQAQGLLPPDYLNQDQLGDNALYPGLRPDYLAAQQMGQGSGLPNPVFGEQPPSLPPVVDRSFPEGTYGTPAPSISDRVTGLFSGDYWPALMNAGLGMLAESGWKTMPTSTGEAIGKGGLIGTKTYMDLRKQYTNEAIAKEEVAGRKQQREINAGLIKERIAAQQEQAGLNRELAAALQSGDKAAINSVLIKKYPDTYFKNLLEDPKHQITEIGVGDQKQKAIINTRDGSVVAKIGDPYKTGPLATATATASTAERPFFKALGDKFGEDFVKSKTSAEDAVEAIRVNSEGRKLLDSGIISGAGANWKLALGKALQSAGVNVNQDAVANTEAFVSNQAQLVGKLIKQFGAGTGLSDADREFATKMAAGSIDLNEKSIRRIMDINDRASRNVIRLHNKRAKKVMEGEGAKDLPFDLGVEEPSESGPWDKY